MLRPLWASMSNFETKITDMETETYPVRPVTLYARLAALILLTTMLAFVYLHKQQVAQQAKLGNGNTATTISEAKIAN
jgi:hypothetical protein